MKTNKHIITLITYNNIDNSMFCSTFSKSGKVEKNDLNISLYN